MIHKQVYLSRPNSLMVLEGDFTSVADYTKQLQVFTDLGWTIVYTPHTPKPSNVGVRIATITSVANFVDALEDEDPGQLMIPVARIADRIRAHFRIADEEQPATRGKGRRRSLAVRRK